MEWQALSLTHVVYINILPEMNILFSLLKPRDIEWLQN